MTNFENRIYYTYACQTGCGHITLTDKLYKTKRTHCAVCGIKTEMRYIDEYRIERINEFTKGVLDLGLSNKTTIRT